MNLRSLLLVGAVVAFTACGQATTTGPSAQQVQSAVTTPPAGPASVTVSIMGPTTNAGNQGNPGGTPAESFSPPSVTISPGMQVDFVNADGLAHTLVADDGSWTTGSLDSEARTTVTFANAGTFHFHDAAHPEIGGTITVQ